VIIFLPASTMGGALPLAADVREGDLAEEVRPRINAQSGWSIWPALPSWDRGLPN